MKDTQNPNLPELKGNLAPEILKKLAKEFSTPLFVYDFDKITNNYNALKDAFAGRKMLCAYALKANSNLSVVSHLAKLQSGADCVSFGEVQRALLAGVPPYRVIFSGVGKSAEEIESALKENILFLNAESFEEVLEIESIAAKIGKVARISVRVNPAIDPQTHPYISTGLSENKFGVNAETAKRIYLYAHKSPHLEPIAIHFHIGSQLTKLEPIAESAKIVADLLRSLLAAGLEIRFFDIGGGVGICYDNESTISPYDYANAALAPLNGLDLTIICEIGRFLLGNAGVLLAKVLRQKVNENKRFVICDAAMNDLVRPSLYNAKHKIEFLGKIDSIESDKEKTAGAVAHEEKSKEIKIADIVGPICESGDFLGKDVEIAQCKSGDLLAILSAGAYGFSMSSQYNTRARAAEVALKDGKAHLIRERENFTDIIAKELKFLEK